jgi:PWWP domain
MADTKLDVPAPAGDSAEPTGDAIDTPASAGKSKARRKSGIPEHKGKKLNKKASKAKMSHSDAKPGDYFYVRLKGYPLWPAIVCDESMLPNTLIKSRPVTAARPDGSYRADFEDGGPKAKDRSFPVMYLHTNEL